MSRAGGKPSGTKGWEPLEGEAGEPDEGKGSK